jgi:dolichyl-phosphate beta-glucosyltransferase
MSSSSVSVTLVLPVYDGAASLGRSLAATWQWLETQPQPGELLIVDDGSRDATPDVIAEFVAQHRSRGRTRITAVRNERNRGKGFAVRRGWLLARGDYVLFTDADLTYPVENLAALVQALARGADVVYGNRMHAASRYVVAPGFFAKLFTRHLLGRAFNLLARALVLPGIADTQAGLKGVRRAAGALLAGRVRLDRFSFDVEMLFVARRLSLTVVDCPVLFLYRKEPSTVRFLRDSARMLRDMLRVRWRSLAGEYDRPLPRERLAELEQGGPSPLPPTVARPVRRRLLGRIG